MISTFDVDVSLPLASIYKAKEESGRGVSEELRERKESLKHNRVKLD